MELTRKTLYGRIMKGIDMKNTLIILILIGLLCSYNISFADVYKYTDDKGIVHMTNMYDSEPCKTYGCKFVMKEKLINKNLTKKQSSVSEKSSSDWVDYSSDNYGNVYSYKKGNIEKNKGKYIVQVWNKTIFYDEGREKEIQRLIKTGLFTETGTKGLSSIIELDEVDCKKKRIRTISLTQYDDDGNVLFSGTDDKSKWDYIFPDSVMDSLKKRSVNNQ